MRISWYVPFRALDSVLPPEQPRLILGLGSRVRKAVVNVKYVGRGSYNALISDSFVAQDAPSMRSALGSSIRSGSLFKRHMSPASLSSDHSGITLVDWSTPVTTFDSASLVARASLWRYQELRAFSDHC